MTMWKACFDESIDGSQEVDCVVGGMIAERRKWRKFYKDWDRALREGRPLRYYSAKDGGFRDDPKSVFYGWTDDEMQRKRVALAHVIRDCADKTLAVAGNLDEYWAVINAGEPLLDDRYKHPAIPCYVTAFQLVSMHMEDEAKRYAAFAIKRPFVLIDDPGKEMKGRLDAIWDDIKAATDGPVQAVGKWLQAGIEWSEGYVTHDPLEDVEPGLQAADLLANAYRDVRAKRRKEFEENPNLNLDVFPRSILDELGEGFLGNGLHADNYEKWKKGVNQFLQPAIQEREARRAAKKAAYLERKKAEEPPPEPSS